MKTIIKAKRNLYNDGLCFTEGKTYVVMNKYITEQHSLIDTVVINDLDEPHQIGLWYMEFEILENE